MKLKRFYLLLIFIFSLFYSVQHFTKPRPIFIEQSKNNLLLIPHNTPHLEKAIITSLTSYDFINNGKNDNENLYFTIPYTDTTIKKSCSINLKKIIYFYSYQFASIIFRYKTRILLS